MEITIKWFDGKYPQFNIELASRPGNDPFITIKGCSLREHEGKEFVGFPYKKLDSGKYWNHVYASDDFQRVVIEKAKENMPQKSKPDHNDAGIDDDIPF